MNGDFADLSSGWTILSDAGSQPGAFRFERCGGGAPQPCFRDLTGSGSANAGSNVLVSSAHTVLPGEALSVTLNVQVYSGFSVSNPDTMHYVAYPLGPVRAQARIDVYDAGNPGFPSAASLQAAVFDAGDIVAGPFLGSLIGIAGFLRIANTNDVETVTFSLAPYSGKTVYFAYRSSSNDARLAYELVFDDFLITC